MHPASDKVVVLVDDEKSYVELLAGMLGDNLNCGVVTFTRPLAALTALPSLRPGIIVTDYFMPQLNGFEFIDRATAVAPGVPFLLITGHTIEAPPPGRYPLLRGMLAKPFGWRRLADAIVPHWIGPPALAIKG